MDFGFNEEQEALRDSFHEFLAGEAPIAYTRAVAEHGTATSAASSTWDSFARLGWLGLNVPEADGGSGLGMLEMVLLMEQAGAVVLAAPLFSTACLGVPAIRRCGTPEHKQRLLAAIASGQTRVTAAWCEDDGVWGAAPTTVALPEGDGFRIHGRKVFVPDLDGAEAVVVCARTETGRTSLYLVPVGGSGIEQREMKTIDATRSLFEMTIDTIVGADCCMAPADGDVAAASATLLAEAQVTLAAEMVGAADAALGMSVEYAKFREQFGKPIGSFQAIQHKCADMRVVLENARSLVYYAAWSLDRAGADANTAAAMAKGYAGEACVKVCQDAVQVHGGVGFTWEHDLHLYLKRVRADAASYGDATRAREAVAKAIGL